MRIRLKFKPQDLWVGVYWRRRGLAVASRFYEVDVWICLVPMLPIHIHWSGDAGADAGEGGR